MIDLRHHLQLSLVALAAALGTLSQVSDASASTSNSESRKRTDSCCLKRSCTVCCCPSTSATPLRESSERPAVAPAAGVSSAIPPVPPCVCRTNDPDSPAPKPVSRSVDQRSDNDRGKSI